MGRSEKRGWAVLGVIVVVSLLREPLRAESLPLVDGVEAQPLKAQVRRVVDALDFLGEPLTGEQKSQLQQALDDTNDQRAVKRIQQILDPLALLGVNINPESRVKVARGAAPARLNEQGWRVFLVKVHNEAGVTAALKASSPNAAPLYQRSSNSPEPKLNILPKDIPDRWMDLELFGKQPLKPELEGLALEYHVAQIYSRDRGKREAKFAFDVGQGTQDLGFRNEVSVLFDCAPAVKVILGVRDVDGKPTTGQFIFRDARGRVYPSKARRLAPDFFFHDQVYRHDGEHVVLPPGKYQVIYGRGPEYRVATRTIEVPATEQHRETFSLQRWIKLADHRWFSGDHHVHAAGCAHYEAPTQGVGPEDMMRHILGEDLNVGCVLSWGPCWYAQKEFFEGDIHKLSTPDYLMRYDVEVSGFPSSHAGHLCLLRLKEDDYPNTTRIEEWPSWDLPVLKWGKEQGGVVGFSHSGWGLELPDSETKLPSYAMPKFNGIGANEYVVDVVHDVCDFISSVDTPILWELSVWYHTLNCGYRCRISGETDFPCIYGDRVGLGRIYVKLDNDQPLNFDAWVDGLKAGRSYCCDGLSHLIDFKVERLGVGESLNGNPPSVLAASSGRKLTITAKAAALLENEPQEQIRNRPLRDKPYWHVERARIGNSKKVPVELVVNGQAVAKTEIDADGSLQDIRFEYTPEISSWIALRIFPSSHTNPVFVELDGKPIRASRRSAQWCQEAVDVCWRAKENAIRPAERPAAREAFDLARRRYAEIARESFDDTR
ncbi:MAG: hypothetical protein FJ295_17720 [Planctomycetes bacterium]|nr:hypothetical protein [Planctomycetota bacterium]